MSTQRAYLDDSYIENYSRPRSTSISSSSRSSSSRESGVSVEHSRRESSSKSPKPKHHKSGSFGRFFGAKEPSLDSFKQLAELQQKEAEKKGGKLPFGVAQTKLPSSVKDDYKKAKQRAKERAKLHEVMRDKMKLHEDEERRHGQNRSSSGTTLTVDDEYRRPSRHGQHFPPSPRSAGNKRFSALDPLPESMGYDDSHQVVHSAAYPPTPPLAHDYPDSGTHTDGLLSGHARREALPWER